MGSDSLSAVTDEAPEAAPESEPEAPPAPPEAPAPAAPEPEAPPAPQPPAPADAQHVAVKIGEDGQGSKFVGLDIDRVSLWNAPPELSVGILPAHTVGISKVVVSGAEPGSTVDIIVLPK